MVEGRPEGGRTDQYEIVLLLGGMTVALTIGLLDVLVVRADAIRAQGTVSAGVDLALGLLLLAAGALLATGRLGSRRKAPVRPSPCSWVPTLPSAAWSG